MSCCGCNVRKRLACFTFIYHAWLPWLTTLHCQHYLHIACLITLTDNSALSALPSYTVLDYLDWQLCNASITCISAPCLITLTDNSALSALQYLHIPCLIALTDTSAMSSYTKLDLCTWFKTLQYLLTSSFRWSNNFANLPNLLRPKVSLKNTLSK